MVELLIIFGAIVAIIYFSHQHRERMSLIKKGEHAGKINLKNNRVETFRLGFFLVGLAIGFVVGSFLAKFDIMGDEIAYVSMLLLFGGVGLLVGSAIANTKKDEDKKEE